MQDIFDLLTHPNQQIQYQSLSLLLPLSFSKEIVDLFEQNPSLSLSLWKASNNLSFPVSLRENALKSLINVAQDENVSFAMFRSFGKEVILRLLKITVRKPTPESIHDGHAGQTQCNENADSNKQFISMLFANICKSLNVQKEIISSLEWKDLFVTLIGKYANNQCHSVEYVGISLAELSKHEQCVDWFIEIDPELSLYKNLLAAVQRENGFITIWSNSCIFKHSLLCNQRFIEHMTENRNILESLTKCIESFTSSKLRYSNEENNSIYVNLLEGILIICCCQLGREMLRNFSVGDKSFYDYLHFFEPVLERDSEPNELIHKIVDLLIRDEDES